MARNEHISIFRSSTRKKRKQITKFDHFCHQFNKKDLESSFPYSLTENKIIQDYVITLQPACTCTAKQAWNFMDPVSNT